MFQFKKEEFSHVTIETKLAAQIGEIVVNYNWNGNPPSFFSTLRHEDW